MLISKHKERGWGHGIPPYAVWIRRGKDRLYRCERKLIWGTNQSANLGVNFMRAKWLAFWHQPVVAFIGWTAFYFVILMVLVYLYGYSGLNNSTFIYNEF